MHRTEYSYSTPMADGFTVARLLPRVTPLQALLHSEVAVTPQPDEWDESLDAFGNRVLHFAVHHPHRSLVVESTVEVALHDGAPPARDIPWRSIVTSAADARGGLAAELAPYLSHTAQTPRLPELAALTDGVFSDVLFTGYAWSPSGTENSDVPESRGVVDSVRSLCHRIFSEFQFDPSFTDVTTPLETVLSARRGVCQDFAHTAVAALRSVGLPARYVSGYIETLPPPGEPKLVGVDASHAWCSVWAGELGWLDFDPTNDQMPPMRHVTVGWGRDYDDVAPVRGVVIGPPAAQSLVVSVDVAELR
ncbi:MAG: transglutaminase family protein [Actinomycetota bacterium]|nr:transglutaminase family protein [Actinomycetota bacterium]